jgi:hypothetical protein
MSQTESHRPLTAEARAHSLFGPCGIYGEQSCIRTGFSPSLSGFLRQYPSAGSPYAFFRPSPKLNNRSN